MELAIAVISLFIVVYVGAFIGALTTFSNEIRDGFKKLLQRNSRKELYLQAIQDVLEGKEDSPRTLWGNYKYNVKYID